MSCNGLDRGLRFSSALALPFFLLLSACEGDGSFAVASTPPPPPPPTPVPTPTQTPVLPVGTVTYVYPSLTQAQITTTWLDSPATRAGSYDLLGRLTLYPHPGAAIDPTNRPTQPGEFTMTVGTPTDSGLDYTLNAPPGILPGNLSSAIVPSAEISWDINSAVAYRYTNTYGDTPQYLGQRLTGENPAGTQLFSYDFTRGFWGFARPATSDTNFVANLDYDTGYSYVAMGEWSWGIFDFNGNLKNGAGSLLFVNGDRTPQSGIPVSGTATYDARSLELFSPGGNRGILFGLTADFGQRLISTQIDQPYSLNAGYSVPGIHVGGSAPFTNNGTFDIPLTGTATWDSEDNLVPNLPTQPVAGTMNGAFFGPHAEQVGGTFALNRTDGSQLMQDAFVGQQHHP
jgi:hypothetical protein